MAALMPLDIARHEVAHMIGAAVAYLGGDNPRMKYLCQHPRYHDAAVFVGYDEAKQQGEFSVIVGKESPMHGPLSDEQVDLVRRSSVLAAVGLARDGNRIKHALADARHWYGLLRDFEDILSPEDRAIGIKGAPQISVYEELVGAFAWPAALEVAPERTEGICKLVAKHGGTGGTMNLREFIPRTLANDILAVALRQAKTCFALAYA